MSNKIGWGIALAILAAVGTYTYSCMKVTGKSSSFHQNLDELGLIFHNHNTRHDLMTPAVIADHVLELAGRAGVAVDEDDIEITADEVEIARDDDDGCVVQSWPDSAMELSPADQGKLSTGISRSCPDLPHWVIGIHVEADIHYGLKSEHLVYDRTLVAVRYSDDDDEL